MTIFRYIQVRNYVPMRTFILDINNLGERFQTKYSCLMFLNSYVTGSNSIYDKNFKNL